MLQSILFATDFRSASRAAEAAVIRLAGTFGSHVTVLHVLEPVPSWFGAANVPQELAAAALAEVVDHLREEKLDLAEPFLLQGAPAPTIVRQARASHADLIVIGTGEGASTGPFRAGPVAEAVVQHAEAPVLAVHPSGPELRLRTVLCPVDGSPAGRHGLENAVRLARASRASVIALTVVPQVTWLAAATASGVLLGAQEEHARMWRDKFDELVHDIDWSGVSWAPDVRYGTAHAEIAASVRDHEADLVVMGSSGRGGLARALLGSTTRRVLRDLPCSLLVVKHEDVAEPVLDDEVRHVEVLVAEGRGLLGAGAFHQAAVHFRQALAHDPFHRDALELLERTAQKLGDSDEAERCRRRLRRLEALA
jgi:nucleotide-binding universal stress UspA family protein